MKPNLSEIGQQRQAEILFHEFSAALVQKQAQLVRAGEILRSENIAEPVPVEVNRLEQRRDRLTANNLIFSANYTHTLHNRQDFHDNSFYQIR